MPVERTVAHLPRLDLELEEATAARHGRPLGPAGIGGPYAVFGPDRRLIGVYRDEGSRARPEVILSP
jgi:tRNA pseudouridine55 synthase